jgi:hypothetical protein
MKAGKMNVLLAVFMFIKTFRTPARILTAKWKVVPLARAFQYPEFKK